MKIVILAGGFGTRLLEETLNKPKPMVSVGDAPILWHIMNLYSMHGYKEFLIALGYKSEIIKEYFLNYYAINNDLSVNLDNGQTTIHYRKSHIDWNVHLIDTGLHTQTGGRIKRLKNWIGKESFMATYGDGLADVNIRKLVTFHKKHGKIATITAVRPPARFGCLHFDEDLVTCFDEKPQTGDGWINGGFMVFNPEIFDYIPGDEHPLERFPMKKLVEDGELMAFRHEGFWQPMDTLRDKQILENILKNKEVPWMNPETEKKLEEIMA